MHRTPRSALSAAALLLALLAAASEALAHGGTYRPPPEDPPPPDREDPPPLPEQRDKDPPPPDEPVPPPAEPPPGLPPLPESGGGTPTPPGGSGPPKPRDGTPTPPDPSGGSKGRRARAESLESWKAWWLFSRDRWLVRPAETAGSATGLGTLTGADPQALPEATDPLRAAWRGRALETVRRTFPNRDVEVFTGCAIALGKGGDPQDAAALRRALKRRYADPTVRESAVLGLGLLGAGAPGAREELQRILLDRGDASRLRSMAGIALGLSRDPAAAPALLATAREKSATRDPAAGALVGLGLLGERLVVPDLVEMLEDASTEDSRGLRPLAAYALGRVGGAEAVRALGRSLSDRDEQVRRAAVLALGECAPADASVMAPLLVRVSREDRDRPCRSFALVTIARIGGPGAHDALSRGWGLGDRGERNFAAIGFGILARSLEDEELRGRILSMLRGEFEGRADPDFRGALAIALGLARDERAVPLLRKVLADRSHPDLRAHCAVALGLVRAREAAPDLRAAVREKSMPDLQREAALGLGLLGDGSGVDTLAGLLREGATAVRVSAATGLGQIGGAAAADPLCALLLDEGAGDLARGQAAVGIGLIVDPRPVGGLAAVSPGLNYFAASPALLELLSIP
jgi:HEAT repeat protein